MISGFAEPLIEVGDPIALDDAETTVVTNLHGPIRLTAALPPHQRARTASTKVNLSSGLAFVPIVAIPTNAAPHSYTLSLREQFKGASNRGDRDPPPYVQTYLLGEHQVSDPSAPPLADYRSEILGLLQQAPTPAEIRVERAKRLRFADARGDFDAMFQAVNPG